VSGIFGELYAAIDRPLPAFGYPEATRSFWQHGDRFASLGAKAHQLMGT
jgi:hypothetical protein